MAINKKMIRNLIVAIVVLALLGGAYLWAVKWQPEQTDAVKLAETIEIFRIEPEQIAKIAFPNFTLVRGEDGFWEIPEFPHMALSQAKLQSTVFSFTEIAAVREIGSGLTNLAEFGLEETENAVTICNTDGSTNTLLLGSGVSVDSTYYFMKKGENTVFTVPMHIAEHMQKTPDDFRERNLGSIDVANMDGFTLYQGGAKVLEVKRNPMNDASAEFITSDKMMVYPYEEQIRIDLFEEMLKPFENTITVVDFISEDRNQAEVYGIGKGYEIVIRTQENTHSLMLGDIAEDGNIYAVYNENPFIFTMKPDVLDAVKDLKPFDLVQKFAHIYSIDQIQSVEVVADGETYTLAIVREGENKSYRINGTDVKDSVFKSAYQAIIGLSFTAVAEENAKTSQKVCEITFHTTDERIEKATYYDYDERNLMVIRPEGKRYLILKKYVTEMLNTVRQSVNS